MKGIEIHKNAAFRKIVDLAKREELPLYLVGGAVRQHFCRPEDTIDNADFLLIGDVGNFTAHVARALKSRAVTINPQFDTVLIPAGKWEFEFSSPRSLLRADHRELALPEDPVHRDLLLRDFTINALAIPLAPKPGEILDPTGGLADIEKRVIRTPILPNITLREDPLRVMRAARLAAQLNFSISRNLLGAMRSERHRLTSVPIERITKELTKILATPKPSVGLKLLYITEVLDVAFPEIAQLGNLKQHGQRAHKNIFEHTLKVLDTVAAKNGALETRLAALLHDIGKPATRRHNHDNGWTFHGHEVVGERMVKKLGKQWKLSTSTTERVAKLVRLHMRPINLTDEGVTDSAVRRLSVEAGEDLSELMILCRADVTSSDVRRVKRYLANFEKVADHIKEVQEKDELRAFQSPVRGDVIMAETGLEPGPLVGKLKKMIEEAILDGKIPNEYEPALNYLREIKGKVLDQSKRQNPPG